MGKLRKTVQREVLDMLDSTVFTSSDFNVAFGDHEENQYIIQIKFDHDQSFFYNIHRQEIPFKSIFHAERSPGDIEERQTTTYDSLQEALSGISSWCIEIRNELKASTPFYNEIDQLRNTIFEHINADNESKEFSVDEINELREKFSNLERRITELEQDSVITEKQLEDFREGLVRVTEDLEYYPKDTWVKTASNKLVKMVTSIGKTKEGRAVLAGGAKKILGIE